LIERLADEALASVVQTAGREIGSVPDTHRPASGAAQAGTSFTESPIDILPLKIASRTDSWWVLTHHPLLSRLLLGELLPRTG
jgi:hypothetical protein